MELLRIIYIRMKCGLNGVDLVCAGFIARFCRKFERSECLQFEPASALA